MGCFGGVLSYLKQYWGLLGFFVLRQFGFGRTESFGASELVLPRELAWPSSRRSGDLESFPVRLDVARSPYSDPGYLPWLQEALGWILSRFLRHFGDLSFITSPS